MLECLVKHYPNLNIRIYGEYKPYFKNPITWLFRRYRKVFLNYNIPPQEVNDLYARTKIALNIHHKQTFNGANQRFFEASGAKAYQICDANPFIRSVFAKGEIGIYENEEQMYALIDHALSHDMSKDAERAYNVIIAEHTFHIRVKRMLQLLKNS